MDVGDIADVSEVYAWYTHIQKLTDLTHIDPEDGGSMYLRNIHIHTILQPKNIINFNKNMF
jgi:hypothetical protein